MKKHLPTILIETCLFSHHAESLAGKTASYQIKLRQIVYVAFIACKFHYIPHSQLAINLRVVIGTISLHGLGIYLGVANAMKIHDVVLCKQIHCSSKTTYASK